MKTTEKQYWVNGLHTRGGWFHTLALSIKNHAILICWGTNPDKRIISKPTFIQLYKLI